MSESSEMPVSVEFDKSRQNHGRGLRFVFNNDLVLTPRQLEILIVGSADNGPKKPTLKEIGLKLGISKKTIANTLVRMGKQNGKEKWKSPTYVLTELAAKAEIYGILNYPSVADLKTREQELSHGQNRL
jgi:DNA-binding CsgD family transcriptional regulator